MLFMHNTDNLHIMGSDTLVTPLALKTQLPLSEEDSDFIYESRRTVERILSGDDPRLLVVVGPCSIHDPLSALDYARRLKVLAEQCADRYYVVMRVYFEKPRTTVGWKGLINDPHLNDSFDIQTGLTLARQLMLDITRIGLPIATEALDPISPQYLADLVSWSAIGARTTESQTHREMASGLSSPVGFKNGTDGNMDVAINAVLSAGHPHAFLGINEQGQVAIIHTEGNRFGHVILRGGSDGPNYDSVSVAEAVEKMQGVGVVPNIVIDCSHGNSHKDYRKQSMVFEDVLSQRARGNTHIKGVMLESFIVAGQQKLTAHNKDQLVYGQSVTDGCIDWSTTEALLTASH